MSFWFYHRNDHFKSGDGIHGTPEYSDDGDYYFVNGNNLHSGKIYLDAKTKRVSFSEFQKYKKELNENTMLVSINGTIGKIAFYGGEKIILGKSACYFTLKDGLVNKIFLYHLIDNPYFIKYAGGNATGSTIKNISLKSMREFPVPYPPIELQNQFAEQIKLIEAQKILVQQNLEKSEGLFLGLLGESFG